MTHVIHPPPSVTSRTRSPKNRTRNVGPDEETESERPDRDRYDNAPVGAREEHVEREPEGREEALRIRTASGWSRPRGHERRTRSSTVQRRGSPLRSRPRGSARLSPAPSLSTANVVNSRSAASSMPSRFVSTAPQIRTTPVTSLHAVAIAQPGEEEHARQHEEEVEKEIRLGDEETRPDSRRDEDEEHERPKDPVGNCSARSPASAQTNATPKSQNWTWSVTTSGLPMSLKRGRIEHGDERRIGRAGKLLEKRGVDAPEEVDHLRFRHPERPGVPPVQTGQARTAKEARQRERGRGDAESRDEQPSVRFARAERRNCPPTSPGGERRDGNDDPESPRGRARARKARQR